MSQDSIGKRIKQVMDEAGLTTTEFSNKLGVQRSGLSHVFNGRNRPGLDLILRVVKVFPQVKYEWLLDGTVQTPESPVTSVTQKGGDEPDAQSRVTDVTPSKDTIEKGESKDHKDGVTNVTKDEAQGVYYTSTEKDKATKNQDDNVRSDPKRAVKIIVLYDDGTFEDFLASEV